MLIVRENNEGEYSEIGGRLYRGTPEELAVQQSIFTRKGCDRIMRYAFELAMKRPRRHVTSATKSNGIIHSMPYWDERFAAIATEYPDVKTSQYHIDILTAHFVQHPDWFDVVVGSNLFGDILSDLGPAIAGSIGIAPGGNINPEKEYPSMFEPVHGSAPDIAGKGIANPDRADLDRRDDARPPRPPGRGARRGGGDRAGGGGRQDAHARSRRPGVDRPKSAGDRGAALKRADRMNYFGHTVLAVRRGGDRAFVLGAMLPDFATMIRARPPRTTHADIDSGMQFHRRTDDVFHRSAAFRR